jgi:hypothetical protein
VFFPPRGEELADVYTQLAADAQNRYLVTYTPLNTTRDGAAQRRLTTTPITWFEPGLAKRPEAAADPSSFEFTVTNPAGATKIGADDLMVVEDGIEQTIDTFHEAAAPVRIVLALDTSGSMRKAPMPSSTRLVCSSSPWAGGQTRLDILFGWRARRA